jgi:lipopolysaccharide transport system ATP-binding protein
VSAVIRFENVSKKFTLHHRRPRSFQEMVVRLFQDPADEQVVTEPQKEEEFWALRDVSFTVEEGETVGLIGPNGAGKSTALKLISRIIEPTSGSIEVNGKIGALLELGAGFHPELSGRENIYLNGSILGLSRAELRAKEDEIISFAELERFIDMPVKHYSSGMRVRLGFSVAVHMEPEVLLIDEVLAVGDQNFQHKCLDYIMGMKRQGVTICFVSHGLSSVRRLCSRAVWLDDGAVQAVGDVDDVVSAYLRHSAEEEEKASAKAKATDKKSKTGAGEAQRNATKAKRQWGTGDLKVIDVSFLDAKGEVRTIFRTGEPWTVRLRYRAPQRIEKPVFGLAVHRNDGLHICGPNTQLAGLNLPSVEGEGEVFYHVDHLPLMEGGYLVSVSAHNEADTVMYDYHDRLHTFKVRQVGEGERYGLVSLQGAWAWSGKEQ